MRRFEEKQANKKKRVSFADVGGESRGGKLEDIQEVAKDVREGAETKPQKGILKKAKSAIAELEDKIAMTKKG